MLNKFIRLVAGDPNKRTVENYREIVQKITAFEAGLEALSTEQLQQKTAGFRQRLVKGETLDELLPEAFAAVREASKRTTGLRHYDVQMIGGISLHRGTVSEMRTGEGKTLVATLPLYLNALAGQGAHLITVNDYLARRDARWMAPIYQALGMSVGVLQMATRDQEGPRAFLVDFERESPHEDQQHLRMVHRRDAYAADITYGTNSEFGFDYLRDNMAMRWGDRVQRGHYFAIIDEADNVLIDEARTPLIISGPAQDDAEWYLKMAQLVRQLRPEDYEISEKDRNVSLTEVGEVHVEELLGQPLRDPERPEDITPEQAHLMGYLEQSLRANFLFKRNKDYLVQANKVVIVDEFTGRLMHGRRWSDGLHQAVEAKEGVKVQPENMTYATVTIQNYFRMYAKLAGMTGTAMTESEEFHKIYKLEVLAIPTNLEYEAERSGAALIELDGKDEEGYKFSYFARRADPEKKPVYWRRKDYPDIVYRTEEMKFRAITQEILRYHVMGRPVLVGTTSVELSDRLSDRLRADPLQRMAQAMLLRKVWLDQHNREEDGRQVTEVQFLYGALNDLPVPEMRKMARELGISFNPTDPENLERMLHLLGLGAADMPRLETALKAGIQHEVLNARKHAEEGQIIAQAGAFGAVTIATNMAGRGVDIRLGGEMPLEILKEIELLLRRRDVAEKLSQKGLPDVDHLSQRQTLQALELVDPEELHSRADAVQQFRSRLDAEEKVRSLGGLHVIGSERHEARRIDNQLRGRAARQGDPGSSRFYLSLEDELMRMFGGEQVDGLMQRLKVDDALPLEVGLVGRLIEQSQTRVEGANFDMRKHLLEYDDVLNAQRRQIYTQRDRVFLKDDLHEDVSELLQAEVLRRVPESLKDAEGPWKLAAWLEQIQPSTRSGDQFSASYPMRLVLDDLRRRFPANTTLDAVGQAVLAVAGEALDAENEHIMNSIQSILDATEKRFEEQMEEGREALKDYLDGLRESLNDEESQPRPPRQIQEELTAILSQQPHLSNEQQRTLRENPRSLQAELQRQLQTALLQQAADRALGAVHRRLEEELELTSHSFAGWDALANAIVQATEELLQRRRERLVGAKGSGSGGQIGRELEVALEKIPGNLSEFALLDLLFQITQGSRTAFDKRTHRRVQLRTTRLNYVFLAGRLLSGKKPDQVAQSALEHLQQAYAFTQLAFGQNLWPWLAGAGWQEIQPRLQQRLQANLGESKVQILQSTPCKGLDEADILSVKEEAGRVVLTEVHRQLLLNVISDLWVDYLTEMEALRLAIRLEAYAQRDPLVQYKSRAAESFGRLFNNLRLGVINRMFTFRPRDFGSFSALVTSAHAAPVLAAAPVESQADEADLEAAETTAAEAGQGRKRRRRR